MLTYLLQYLLCVSEAVFQNKQIFCFSLNHTDGIAFYLFLPFYETILFSPQKQAKIFLLNGLNVNEKRAKFKNIRQG